MSFSFRAAGTRDETVASLRDVAYLTGDSLGGGLRDLLADHLNAAADTDGLRYEVTASGHSGDGSVLTLTATVTAGYPPQAEAWEEAARPTRF
jgi:hypothetical protein